MSSKSAVAAGGSLYNGIHTRRPAAGIINLLLLGITQISHVAAAPLKEYLGIDDHGEPDAEGSSRWLMLTVAAVLVLLGGAFAGLTIALMGQDNIYLQVIATSGEGKERRNAEKVLTLLKRGKHWVLVTLLLSNVIVNETLPIVLDHSLGGGWLAVLISTAMIVIFGEVIPQSICVRWGLPIGAFMAYPVLVLMYIMGPIAWPTAKLLDRLIGEDHGTVYKKAGLKTLVTLHKTLGSSPTERLNQDEVTIITAVLELKDKSVGDIMTPIEDTFTMCEDTVLDDDTIVMILNAGYSRIPIYAVDQPGNFTGMLLVKMLITYDPEDCKKVKDFALATLPETRPETCCLDIINFFQEGKSHMILVSDTPGECDGAIGVVTLEDVIEELIGEEIIDESDVFVDVHKAIRRLAPAPKARYSKGPIIENLPEQLIDVSEDQDSPLVKKVTTGGSRAPSPAMLGTSPKTTFMRRGSASVDGRPAPMRGSHAEMLEHLKHLGPSNLASRPKTTRINTVKIKAGHSSIRSDSRTDASIHRGSIIEEEPYSDHPVISPAPQGGEGEGLLTSGGLAAKDGVQALQQGYGSFAPPSPREVKTSDGTMEPGLIVTKTRSRSPERKLDSRQGSQDSKSSDTVGSLMSVGDGPPRRRKKGTARSGSITENIIHADGIRKVILETTASSSDELVDENTKPPTNASKPSLLDTLTGWNNSTSSIPRAPLPLLDGNASSTDGRDENAASAGDVVKKKRRRNRKKKGPKNSEDIAEGSVDGSTGPGGK